MKELIYVLDLTLQTKVKKHVKERCECDRCLEGDCTLVQYARGLCRPHFNRFCYVTRGLSERKRMEVEVALIRNGRLLRAHDKSMRAPKDVFAAVVKKLG